MVNKTVRFGYIDRNLRRIQRINQKNIPKVKNKDFKRQNIDDSENFTNTENCVICYNDFGEDSFITDLPKCHHIYHYKCISEWFKINSKCPMCKEDYLHEFDGVGGEAGNNQEQENLA